MTDRSQLPDSLNHAQAARNAAIRARALLGPVLRQLQESALVIEDLKVQTRLLRAAEQVAETASMLFELEHSKKSAFESLTATVRARDHLRTALSALQAPEMAGCFPEHCAQTVASALAIVFAAAKGGDWQDREALRCARRRALMMRVPVAKEADEQEEVVRTEDSMPPIPLSRKAVPAPSPQTNQGSNIPPSKKTDSRRWNRRLTGRSVLEVDVGLVSESQFYAGLTMDLSTGGLFVATYQIQPVGTPVAVSLVLPGGHSVWAKGKVRWVREPRGEESVPGMGVEFTDIDPADLEAITAFCQVRSPMYFDSDDED